MNLTNLLDFVIILLNINQRKPYLTLVTGDFNVRSSSWLSDNINTTEGTKLLSLTSRNGFQQIVNEPTHLKKKKLLMHWFNLSRPTKPISYFRISTYQDFIHLYTPFTITGLFNQNLISISFIFHHTNALYGLLKSRCI